jgi:hypothetical protein
MSISFGNAVAHLKSMFPEWDEEMLGDVLVSNNYHVEKSIETILTFSGESSEKASGESERADTGKSGDEPYAAPTPKAPRPATRPAYRGKRVKLADDFLRSPTTEFNQAISQDEELARMLQNELFREEVKKSLGKDALSKDSKAGSSSGDMLKTVSSMGAAAKKNLLSLADRFKGNSRGLQMNSNSGDSEVNNESEYVFDNKARGQHLLDGELDGAENPLLSASEK